MNIEQSAVFMGLTTKAQPQPPTGTFERSARVRISRDAGRVKRVAVGCSDLLGHVCNLIQAAQKQIWVAEIRKHANRSLGRQACRAPVRGNSDKRNTDATTCTRVPDTIANVNSASDSAIALGCPSHRQPDDGLSVQRIVARSRRVIVVAQASTCHFETRRVTPRASSKGNPILCAISHERKQYRRSGDCCKSSFG